MTNFFDEITSFFTILSEDREKLLSAPVLDIQENKNIFRSDQSASGLIFSTKEKADAFAKQYQDCLLYTSPSPRDLSTSRMPSSA